MLQSRSSQHYVPILSEQAEDRVAPDETFIGELRFKPQETRIQARKKRRKDRHRNIAIFWLAILLSAIVGGLLFRYVIFNVSTIPSESMEDTLGVGDRIVTWGIPIQYVVSTLSTYPWILGLVVVLLIVLFAVKKRAGLFIAAILVALVGLPLAFLHVSPARDTVNRGDVIVFEDKYAWLAGENMNNGQLVKRVIGVPGDTVEVTRSGVYVNGEYVSEPYIKFGCPITDTDYEPRYVGADEFYVLGDNRCNSADSRQHENDGNRGLVDRDQIVGKVFGQ